MAKFNESDYIGKKYGLLTILEIVPSRGHRIVKVRCDCNTIKNVFLRALKEGGTVSCGCFRKSGDSSRKHGECGSRLYYVWVNMIRRCYDIKEIGYSRYGGRGISICKEWDDYPTFSKWAKESGYDQNAPRGECTLDRINNDGNYCPENCRWVSLEVQATNTRKTLYKSYNDEIKCISEWAKDPICKVPRNLLTSRLRNGWNMQDALTTPKMPGGRSRTKND